MHLPTAARPVRVRRLLSVSAIAAVVVLAPVAGASDALDRAEPSGNHAGHAVVPVGNTADSEDDDAESDNSDNSNDDESQNSDDDNESRNSDDDESENSESSEPLDAPAVPPGGPNGDNNGLDVLGRDCSDSELDPHDGFQESPACVSTQMGEVAAEDKLPSLLITEAPETVEVDESFELEVSTRNLVRDRFLGAAEGGYYLESSFLDDDGLQRGHFHTACRILSSNVEARTRAGIRSSSWPPRTTRAAPTPTP